MTGNITLALYMSVIIASKYDGYYKKGGEERISLAIATKKSKCSGVN